MSNQFWDIQGKIVIPGSRKAIDFGPVRIGGTSIQDASAKMAPVLQETFKAELPEKYKFGAHFALMNLNWKPLFTGPGVSPTIRPLTVQELGVLVGREQSRAHGGNQKR